MKFKKHVFICTNERPEGKECCGEKRGMALIEAFKKELKDRKLQIEIRAQRAGCIDVCSFGPALVVYPEGVFYGKVELSDVAEIVESHLVNNIPVERLKLTV
jgi:(2Fe-2S) ferredoxin